MTRTIYGETIFRPNVVSRDPLYPFDVKLVGKVSVDARPTHARLPHVPSLCLEQSIGRRIQLERSTGLLTGKPEKENRWNEKRAT